MGWKNNQERFAHANCRTGHGFAYLFVTFCPLNGLRDETIKLNEQNSGTRIIFLNDGREVRSVERNVKQKSTL
jgi:hypothetical protein